MRRLQPLLMVPALLTASTLHTPAQSASDSNPPLRAIWKNIAPHIDAAFAQSGRDTCTWRFRNSDDVRTLQSMRFSFTYSSITGPRSPISLPPTKTGEDTLFDPLGPREVSSAQLNYQVPGNCATVTIRVIEAKWI